MDLELSIVQIIAASLVSTLVKHLRADDPKLQHGDPLVEAVLVPTVLLDGTKGSDVTAGHAEHGLGTLDGPEQTLLLVHGHGLLTGDGTAPLHLGRTEHKPVLLQLSLQ